MSRPALSSAQKAWLQRLAELVMEDYRPRQAADFAYFNNHDYWAGWAVAASGMLLGRDDYVAWAGEVANYATTLNQLAEVLTALRKVARDSEILMEREEKA